MHQDSPHHVVREAPCHIQLTFYCSLQEIFGKV